MKVCKAALAGWVQGQEGLTRWDTILCSVFLPCLYTSAHILLNANAGQEGRLLRAHKSRIDFQWDTLLSPLTMGAVFANRTSLSIRRSQGPRQTAALHQEECWRGPGSHPPL